MFDTFISYRRKGGAKYASLLFNYLKYKDFSPFFDRAEMENGRFDEQIKKNIIGSTNFILILSQNALDRVSDEEDWVRKEIELAIAYNKNIILLAEDGFLFPDELPGVLDSIRYYETYFFNDANFHSILMMVESALNRQDNVQSIPSQNKGNRIKISGEYITIYEDNDHGKVVNCKAPATLKRVGNYIYGETSFGSSMRWKLRGKVFQKKRIAGTYFAKSAIDDGFGTFYLEIKSDSLLDGYWCGYDNVNKKIFSGKYVFKKKYSNYTIREMRKTDFPFIVRIADEKLGKGYVDFPFLESLFESGEKYRCFVAEDGQEKHAIAFCIYGVLSPKEVVEVVGKEVDLNDILYVNTIGYLKTLAVASNYQGYGIASDLVKHALRLMDNADCKTVFSTAWKHLGVTNIENVLLNNGFTKRDEIPNYWYEDSIEKGYSCPQCGNPCRCSCVIFSKY